VQAADPALDRAATRPARTVDSDPLLSGGQVVVYLVTSHFFEHVLDYVYIFLLVVAVGGQ
jgi:hypothetical protein